GFNFWWGELELSGWYGAANHTLTAADNVDDETHKELGHWSHAAWSKTWRIGCGISKSTARVCCHYGPGGRPHVWAAGPVIYPMGEPCKTNADCTNNAGDKCNVADGLCVHA
ncbi:activation-associated secreted protein-1, partial [Aphelenchoides avenae]